MCVCRGEELASLQRVRRMRGDEGVRWQRDSEALGFFIRGVVLCGIYNISSKDR